MYWIVLADTNLYRIYSYQQKTKQISLLTEKYHPESKEKSKDLVTDSPGHYKTRTEARGIYASHSDPKENEIDHFLRTLAEEIEAGRINNRYKKYVLIALPRVSGLIIGHLNKNTQQQLFKNIQKDYMHLPEHDLRNLIQEKWREFSK